MNSTRLALSRPVTTFMLWACLGVIGLLSTRMLPLEYLPDIEFPAMVIEVPYSNSSPEEVERRIVRPAEEVLATLTGVRRMHSEAREDGAFILLFFGWDEDLSTKGVEARDKMDSIRHRLPEDVERVLVSKFSATDTPFITLRISSERDLSNAYDMLNRNLRRRVERLAGVSKVELYGVERNEIRIELDAARVQAHGVDLRELGERLENSNFALSAGEITDHGRRLRVQPDAHYSNLDEIRNLLVDARGTRLQDIAEIRYTQPVPTRGRHLNQRYAIGLSVYKETGANLVEVSDRVMAEVDAVGRLPEMQGIHLFVMENQGDGVRDSLSQLLRSGLLGALLSVLVLYLFLRHVGMTLVVTMAVPFSILVTMAVMYFFGFSLNILTLMGLMLSIGSLVDNAVVVTENVFRQHQLHPHDPRKATITGVDEVGTAILAGTLTSVIVFLPNIVGEKIQVTLFMSHVAVTICTALLASLVIARTLIPLLTYRLLRGGAMKDRRGLARVGAWYERWLRRSLAHPWIMAVLIIAVSASVVIPAQWVDKDIFPEDENRRLVLRYNLNTQYALDKVEAAVDEIETYLFANQQQFEIDSVYSYYDIGQALTVLLLTDADKAEKSTRVIKQEIREGLPAIAIGKPSFEQQRTGGTQAPSVHLYGESSETLRELALDVVRVLESLKGIEDVRIDAGAEDWEVRVRVHPDRARVHGLSSQEVAQAVAVAMRGISLNPYRGPQGEVDLRVQFSKRDRANLDQLLQVPLRTADGGLVSLAAVADWEIGKVPGTIVRVNRATSLQIEMALDDITSDESREKIEAALDVLQLPPGYHWNFGASFDEEQETGRVMAFNTLLALALIYIVMAALFESLLFPLSIISGILFSVIGVFWFFLLTDTTLSLMAWIGLLVLMGIVVNNGIVLVDHVNHLRWSGMAREEAIIQGVRDRMRPILMTVCTTVLGLVPLAIGDAQIGGDGPPYYPMARAIIGGLAFSTLVSLFALPSLYLWLDRLSEWVRGMLRETARSRPQTGQAADR